MASPIRITGMNSGLDTESIIQALTSNQKEKVTKLEGNQKRLTWKQDKWKELNKKVTDLYNGKIAAMRFTDAFSKKTTTLSRPSAATVVTGAGAMNTTQKMKITNLASNAYLTGGELKTGSDGKGKVTASTKLSELTGANFTSRQETVDAETATYRAKTDESGKQLYLRASSVENGGDPEYVTEIPESAADGEYIKAFQEVDVSSGSPVYKDITDATVLQGIAGDEERRLAETTSYRKTTTIQDAQKLTVKYGDDTTKEIDVTGDMKVSDLVNKLKEGGKLNVNFDEGQGRLYIASAKSGSKDSFSLDFGNNTTLGDVLGLSTGTGGKAKYEAGSDAKLTLNGVDYTSSTNNFEINGLTITANEVTDSEITLTTKNDTSGVYDMVKGFIKEYNELINEMDKLYSADSAKSYEMLTDEMKEAMTDDEVKDWENKIKDGLLARDTTLNNVASALKEVMSGVYEATNGKGETKSYSLMNFGIDTLSYFSAKQNERYAYHINGDQDDANFDVKNATDTLSKMITDDPDLVSSFFSTLSKALYGRLTDLMKGSEFSSSYTLYEDKLMNKQYSSYTDKITNANEKLTAMEDKYYKKFSKMETTMGKLNSTQSSLSGYFGM